ncbi:MAG TPA: carboxypeptidase regulatory-like domain-containing protein, partial [Rhodanobacteraceae bacterium]|nr:carboxypeptidase regulatory-like domain-containing protein [Rhodanobacteraceae bacterium]
SVPLPVGPEVPAVNAPAPAPLKNFAGLDLLTWGAGVPPDTNGDVGPTYFVQTVNTAVGIYDKSTGAQVAAFSFNTLMSQGNFGNTCDTNNAGDPVVVYDTFEDRWIITDFAFFGIGSFQCFAVSKTGNPVSGGWNFYSIAIADAFGDYPKFGIWPDGLYMMVNLYTQSNAGTYMHSRAYALNKAQMYGGAPDVQVVAFDFPARDFSPLPANARLQTGTPPPGSPNYYSVAFQYFNAISIYKFHVDWARISTSALTGPFVSMAPTSWATPPFSIALPGGNTLETVAVRMMAQNQYTNIGNVESVWSSHSVQGGTAGTIAPRFYQVNVTGGSVSATTTQAFTHAPDTMVNRWMPSLSVDGLGDMAIGYSVASPTLYPAIRYAGRLSTDPLNTLPQTETSLVEGTSTSVSTTRWGDYSSLSLDPDRCTFWVSNEYYMDPFDWETRIGSFKLSNAACDPVTTTLSGKVTAAAGGAAIAGATVSLGGGRSTTTNALGIYAFNSIAWGTYPSMTANAPGYDTATAVSIAVSNGPQTTKNFSLTAAPVSACSTDTTQADFQFGVPVNVDLTTNPGDAILGQAISIDQQNTVANTGGPFSPILAQTFTPAVTDRIRQLDLAIVCATYDCSTVPDVTVSIRATAGTPAAPTGPDLATATILKKDIAPGGYVSVAFASPPILTAGTRYAIVMTLPSNPDAATLHTVNSNTDAYPNNGLVYSYDGGSTWTAAPASLDMLFRTYVPNLAGDLISTVKDADPASGFTPTWSTLSWTAVAPANTLLRFQVAASNSQYGPFNFVGPNGTAATYYTTSGGSLAQFNGKRYLRYRAYLSNSVRPAGTTPTLSDATVCFTNVPPPDLSISNSDGAAFAIAGAKVVYTIIVANADPVASAESVTVNDTFLPGLTCNWSCTGSSGASCLASGSGDIVDTSVNLPPSSSVTYSATCSIAGAATGSVTSVAQVTFAGDPNIDNNRATDIDTLRTSARCYVQADAKGTNTGASWPNAYTDLQSALHDSSCNEIWVARGVYKPTSYVDASSRSASFLMPRGVGVYGGFTGGETLLSQRDVAVGSSVLSGDIDNDDAGTNGVDANTNQIAGNN